MGATVGSKRVMKPYYNSLLLHRGGQQLGGRHIAVLLGLLVTAILGLVYGGKTLYTHVLVAHVLDTPIIEPAANLVLDLQQHAAYEMLLRQITEECAKRQDTVIYLDSKRQVVTEGSINPRHCPLIDLALSGNKRGIGSCTDAALYVLHAGARLIPLPQDVEGYDGYCGSRTARMFMDWIYPQLISKTRGVLHMQLVSTNMWWARDAPLHASMQVFLCKTLHCVGLMQQHVVQQHYWGSVWFMGHTSSDPTVGTSGDIIAQVTSSINPGSTEGFAIHVRGQSDRKQTKVVLDCWAHHPNFPPLVLVGKPADQELTNASRSAANIVYYPPLAPAESDSRGDDTIDGTRVRNLAAAAFMHICPSQSEGFGHYINEARAAGALIVTTRHPPMNEVVSDEQGVQVPTVLTDSDEGMGLADVGNLNGHVSAEGLCQAVQLALALPAAEQQKKRAAAAAAYRAEKAAFLSRMAQLRAYLHARRAAAAENFSSSSATAEAAAASLALASSSAGAEGAAARAAIGRKVGLVQ